MRKSIAFMRFPPLLMRFFLLLVCGLNATAVAALTLERVRGAAVLGRPLDITVPLQFQPGEESGPHCFKAEVVFGDIQLAAGAVIVREEGAASAQSALLRIATSQVIDEPVVVVVLRAGCDAHTTRRYVLLADMPTEPAVEVAKPATVVREPAGTQLLQTTTSATPAVPHKVVSHAPVVLRRAVAVAPPAVKARARLKLSIWEQGPEPDPSLKLTDRLAQTPSQDLPTRAEAAAIWHALNEPPEAVIQREARAQTMDNDVSTLRDMTMRNQKTLTELGARLQAAEQQRYANPLVYMLALLLLAVSVVAGFGWLRLRDAGRTVGPWWGEASPDLAPALAAAPAPMPPDTQVPPQSPITVPPLPGAATVDIDLPVGEPVATALPIQLQPQRPIKSMTGAANQARSRGFAPSVAGALRAINAKEMLDVRQKAEFFMTLGQYEEAIAVLQDSMRMSERANPLVYMDLLKIFHTLSREHAFEECRSEFNRAFSGMVPPYVRFHQGGQPIEAYPEILERIVTLWPSAACVDALEECMARSDANPYCVTLDLEAFRDLLMLHGVLMRLDSISESAPMPFSVKRATLANDDIPLSVRSVLVAGALDVDIDLNHSAFPDHNLIDFEVSGFSSTEDR